MGPEYMHPEILPLDPEGSPEIARGFNHGAQSAADHFLGPHQDPDGFGGAGFAASLGGFGARSFMLTSSTVRAKPIAT